MHTYEGSSAIVLVMAMRSDADADMGVVIESWSDRAEADVVSRHMWVGVGARDMSRVLVQVFV